MQATLISEVDFRKLNLITSEQAHTFQVIPYHSDETHLHFFVNQNATDCSEDLAFLMGKPVVLTPVDPSEFIPHLHAYYPDQGHSKKESNMDVSQESDIVRFVNKLFEEAVSVAASDIHIERYESFARVRFRWEGQLIEKYDVAAENYNAVVSRIKIMADLDISERRLPQDGRINLELNDQKIDVRVSTIPGKFGEKVVMRLLMRSKEFLQLENLGMKETQLHAYLRSIRKPNGIILITGPTGSGKTTTLYASLSLLNTPEKNIITIEDPIEYNIEGINQVQLKEEIGLSFDKALKSFLRQDPDIIMVGEIRDKATAEIAIRAALTGHLVMSTLHTNSALDAIVRLLDMGVPAYLLAASLRMVVAQRLVRVLCEQCKQPVSDQGIQKFVAKGCPSCNYTGFARRKALYELVSVDESLARSIKDNSLDKEAYFQAHPDIQTIKDEALELVAQGGTTLKEAEKLF